MIPLVWLDQHPSSKVAAASCGVAWGVSTLCLLHGSYAFAERKLPAGWYVVAFACAPAAFILGIDPSDGMGMLPLLWFQSAGLGTAGVLTIRAGRDKAGAWLAGLALIGLALHLLDGPVFAANPDLMPWGFVIATALELLAALGMVTFFYEHTRALGLSQGCNP